MPVSVGQTITASLWNANIGVASPHAEWTATSGSAATGTSSNIGTLVLDATTTNTAGNSLATISTNTLTISADGLYDLSLSGSLPVSPTGAFYVTISDGTNQWRFGATAGTVITGAIVSAVRWPAGTVLTFVFIHNSAASRVLTSRWMLTKIGTY